jgi:hypothetical protein
MSFLWLRDNNQIGRRERVRALLFNVCVNLNFICIEIWTICSNCFNISLCLLSLSFLLGYQEAEGDQLLCYPMADDLITKV